MGKVGNMSRDGNSENKKEALTHRGWRPNGLSGHRATGRRRGLAAGQGHPPN